MLVGLACVLAYLTVFFIDSVPGLPKTFVSVLSFPVSTGALLAMFFEIVIPKNPKRTVNRLRAPSALPKRCL